MSIRFLLRSFYIYSFVVLLGGPNPFEPLHAPYSQGVRWTSPQTIPGLNLESIPPILIADQNRTVHAFSSQWLDLADGSAVKAIVYNQWTLDHGWSEPIDILLSPIYEARVTDVYLDAKGILHLVFFGGNSISADIYYSHASLASADDVRSWSPPILVGEKASDPESAVITQNDQGDLSIIFYGHKNGNGLYVINSNDEGNNWTEPVPFFLTSDDKPNIFALQTIKSESGWLHTVWALYSREGQGRGIYYSRSRNGKDWDEPIVLADAQEGLGTQTPTIIENKGELFVVYNLTPKLTMQRSMDDGNTWLDPVTLFKRHVGVNGTLSMVNDGNDGLHLFFGQRITGNPDIHGMWHSEWINERWSEPEAVVKGPRIVDKVGNNGFDPYDAQAIISQGNVILVTWRTDPGDIKENGVWYSSATLDIPELPVIPPLAFPITNIHPSSILAQTNSSGKPTLTPIPVEILSEINQLPQQVKNGYVQNNPTALILIGVISVLAFLVIIFVYRFLIKSRRNSL